MLLKELLNLVNDKNWIVVTDYDYEIFMGRKRNIKNKIYCYLLEKKVKYVGSSFVDRAALEDCVTGEDSSYDSYIWIELC